MRQALWHGKCQSKSVFGFEEERRKEGMRKASSSSRLRCSFPFFSCLDSSVKGKTVQFGLFNCFSRWTMLRPFEPRPTRRDQIRLASLGVEQRKVSPVLERQGRISSSSRLPGLLERPINYCAITAKRREAQARLIKSFLNSLSLLRVAAACVDWMFNKDMIMLQTR